MIPNDADEMQKQMQIEAKCASAYCVNYYIFHEGKLIGCSRLFFHDDATKTLQIYAVWLVRSAWGMFSHVKPQMQLKRLRLKHWVQIVSHASAVLIIFAAQIQFVRLVFLWMASHVKAVYHDDKLYDNLMCHKIGI